MVQEQLAPQDEEPQVDLLPEEDSAFEGEAGGQVPPMIITIDDIAYPCLRWGTVENVRVLERRYDQGFIGGVGIFSEAVQTRPDQLYAAVNADISTFPYIRLLPRRITTDLTDKIFGSNPTYMFVAEDANADEYLFIYGDRYAKKVYLHEPGGDSLLNTVASSKDFGAGAVCGRPVLFEGKWRIPLGDSVEWVTLTTVSDGGGADTYTGASAGGSPAGSRRATHFATGMQEGVAQIWRAHNNDADDAPAAGVKSCRVSSSADAITFGASFEVGDTSLPITDLLSIAGELFIPKPDAPYRFSSDGGGNTFPIMEFVDKQQYLSGYTGDDGANSGCHGPYAYWTHSSGLWRVIGDNATPVDPMSEPHFSGLSLAATTAGGGAGMLPSYYGRWLSATAYGHWMYATEAETGLWHGYINEDGTIRWLGTIFSSDGTSKTAISRACVVTTSTAPILYVVDNNSMLYRIDLQEDGSIRKVSTPGTNRGGDDEISLVVAPETNFGEPEKQKQVRMMWVNTDDMASAFAIRCLVYRDRSTTPTQIGSDVASGGKQEESATPGSSDTFTDCHPALELDTGTFAEATEDPRIRSWGIRAVTPHVYKAVIPVSPDGMRGFSLSVKDALKKLRDLKSGASIDVREPTYNATFTGYIRDVRETVLDSQHDQIGYALEVYIERWVL